MLKAAILTILLATLVATYLTRSFIAPGIGAALLFAVLLCGWLYNRGASRANWRKSEEATHRSARRGRGVRTDRAVVNTDAQPT